MNPSKLIPYLSPKALTIYQELVDAGVDQELALVMVEINGTESEVYELENDVESML